MEGVLSVGNCYILFCLLALTFTALDVTNGHEYCADISSIEAITIACFDRNYTDKINAPKLPVAACRALQHASVVTHECGGKLYVIFKQNKCLLHRIGGAFAKLRNSTVGFVMSAVRPPVFPRGTTWLPLDGIS